GYRKWGDRMVQDIIDATVSVVDKGLADSKRICIYGAGFGGYAALQSAVRAPALFRCVVSNAGIYDLSLMPDLAHTAETLGPGFAHAAVGDDLIALRRASPVYDVDKIRARVLFIHGERDRRAPFEQAERLRKSLAERGRPPEWLAEPTEGHGFYGE